MLDRKLNVSSKTSDTGETSTSNIYDVEYGTPQGSVLGPLIFLIFCNDLHLHLVFLSCIQFTDDTTLYISHTNIDYIKFCLEHDLSILQDWFLANKLTLNISKSTVILFGKHDKRTLAVHIGNQIIAQASCTKFLGIWIDEQLNWCKHTNKLLLKLNANLNLLKVGRNCLTQHALRVIYFAQIQSNLSYGIGIWGSLIPKETVAKLQRIQTTSLRIMNGAKLTENKLPTKLLTVEQLIELELCKMWHKKH